MKRLLLEGYSADEILALSNEGLRTLVLRNEALVFQIGSASLPGRFAVADDALIIELGHIDGGGEGALPSLGSLAAR